MRLTSAIFALCATVLPTASLAQANCNRPPENHLVSVQKNGFFPSELFICDGDTIYFENRSGYWAKFNQNYLEGQPQFHSYWVSNGATVGPLQAQQGMGMRIENLDLWNVSNYTYPMDLTFGSPVLEY